MMVNPHKMIIVRFTRKRKLDNLAPLNIQGEKVPFSNEAKSLGVIPEKTLNWNAHLEKLCDGHILNDYSVAQNHVILLTKRVIPLEEPNVGASSSNEDSSQNEEEDRTLPAESSYYSIGDYIDAKDLENEYWFEAKILGIFKKEEQATEQDLLFKVKSADHVSPVPYENFVNFANIRPASYYNYEVRELEPGMTVLANYNIDAPKDRGDWYDFHITKVGRINISGIVLKGSEAVPNCDIKFIHEVLRIEEPKLRSKQLVSAVIYKRKYPYDCEICRDNMSKNCKVCSCTICGSKDNWGEILLCDECDKGFHLYCLDPPMETVPNGDWYCSSCKTDTSEIVHPGEKLKVTKKNRNKNTSKKDWGRGMACVGVSEKNDLVPKNHVGSVPGIEVGTCWKFRQGVSSAGVHRPIVAGIHGKESHCAYSVVLSGGYEDDVDNGNEFYYTGAGGRDLSGNQRTGKQCFDQELIRTNKALALNCYAKFNSKAGATATNWKKGKPVRVVRSYKLGKNSQYAPKDGYRYDGLYKVVRYFTVRGQAGHMVWRYLLRRDDPAFAPWEEGGETFDIIYPPNYQESQAEKKKIKEEEKKLKKQPGTSQQNRPSTSRQKKKKENGSNKNLEQPKHIPYKLKPIASKAINNDTVNKNVWLECKAEAKEGQERFFDKVKEAFMCIICRSLVHNPVTLRCHLNICWNCLNDALKHCDTEDFHCPHCREILGKTDTFIKEVEAFKNDKLKAALNTLFPGYRNI